MPETDSQRLELANRVRERLGKERELSPLQARAFVRSVQSTWQVETIFWSERDSTDTLSEAYRLVHAGDVLRRVEGGSKTDSALAFRRAAELFEWLARSSDGLAAEVPLALFAGGAYQLGGMPAMAAAMLNQTNAKDDGIQLFAAFIGGNLDETLRRIAGFWDEHPELTTKDAAGTFFTTESPDDLPWMATVELVRSIGLAADSLRRGDDDRLKAATTQLRNVERFLVRYAPEDVAMAAFFLRTSCDLFAEANIYGCARSLSALRPDRIGYLNGFARRQHARGRGVLWESQHAGIKRLLSDSSFALCTPTGSGKTLVANFALIKELLLLADGPLAPLALYLVPSRALAGEVEAKLISELGSEFIVTGLYGGTDWGVTDAWLTSDIPVVLIATVEKADALMRYLGPTLLARMRLLILDEAHQVVVENSEYERNSLARHTSRAARLESFVARLLARKPEIIRIALTAVAGGAAGPVARWIEGRADADPVGVNYRSTRQAVGALEIRPNGPPEVLFDMLNGQLMAVRGRDQSVYMRLRIPPMPKPPAKVRDGLNRYTQVSILWTALHLVEGKRRILISVTQGPEDTIKWLADAFSLKGWEEIGKFTPPADASDAELYRNAIQVCADYCGVESYELKLLRHGIATNYGQMPQKLRRLMVALIERSVCSITIATATLTEGVNLPFDLILLPSLLRTSFNPAARPPRSEHPMTAAEFRNLSGRAGRPGASTGMEGMTLVVLPVAVSTDAPGKVATQTDQIDSRRAEYDALLARLQAADAGAAFSPLSMLIRSIRSGAALIGVQRDQFEEWLEAISPSDVSVLAGTGDVNPRSILADSVDELDNMLLSAIQEVEALEPLQAAGQLEGLLIAVWRRSFALVASAYEDWMERAFIRRGVGLVANVYPDAVERRELYSFGFTPLIGRRFREAAEMMLDIIHYADRYGHMSDDDRLNIFVGLGKIIADDGGYGYFVRANNVSVELFGRWDEVLAWWMSSIDAPKPVPDALRAWQTFVADNFEYRLSVAIGAAVALRWKEQNEDPFSVPSLQDWKEKADLPWFAFWARELLRWGTLDPFVAFAMSQGIAVSREDAADMKPEFAGWFEAQDDLGSDAETFIDPRVFLRWQKGRAAAVHSSAQQGRPAAAQLVGTDGSKGRYSVLPLRGETDLKWLDPAGYQLATSHVAQGLLTSRSHRNDYELRTSEVPEIIKVF
ncbi:DEAD/DEAH box helicase [Rhizobium ruizarguesonis]|uniref:DEAD/DEAH box helicase n=1 Tax=Rhizobium ruizarguesonis TaxID=2081791 RepID=UPI001031610A|nr:DEAD/DEAH box helicase [Rhizobium ruizarguesonis]TBE77259.1 DEAD/DEAH box helicase [Rhizobium ruizarguesonis]